MEVLGRVRAERLQVLFSKHWLLFKDILKNSHFCRNLYAYPLRLVLLIVA